MWNFMASNKYFQVLEERKNMVNHYKSLNSIKPIIRSKSPIIPKFLKNNKKKISIQRVLTDKINYENKILSNKLNLIKTKSGRLNPKNVSKKYSIKPKEDLFSSKFKLHSINKSNSNLITRIQSATSIYNKHKFLNKDAINNKIKYNIMKNARRNNNNFDFSNTLIREYSNRNSNLKSNYYIKKKFI